MAVLVDADRAEIHALWMRENTIQCGTMTKSELRDAVNAIDQWVEDNAGVFNSAIPLVARTALNGKQKAWLLYYVVRRRFEVS